MSLNELREMQSNRGNAKLTRLIDLIRRPSQDGRTRLRNTTNFNSFNVPLPDEINLEKYKL